MKKTELIAPLKDISADPRFAVCYGRGAVLQPEGNFLRVESGKRSLVHRSLCVVGAYETKCWACPNFHTALRLPYVE